MPRHALSAALLFALAASASASASAGSFTYRGQLAEDGRPANGLYDLQITLYADAAGTHPLAGPIELADVAVSQGSFAAALDLPETSASTAWMQVAVRPVGEFGYWPLGAREAVSLKGAVCPSAWELGGNAATLPAVNFLGTTDAQPLELRTANTRSLRIEPSGVMFNGMPITSNLIGGSSTNAVNDGVRGATLAGGGAPLGGDQLFSAAQPNRVSDHYGTVGGGFANVAGNANADATDAPHGSVGGGRGNQASGEASTVAGGENGIASGLAASVGGGSNNTASASAASIAGGINNRATGGSSAIGGGSINLASGLVSVIPGGRNNCAGGEGSFAAGTNAKVLPAADPGGMGGPCTALAGYTGTAHDGTFAWADNQSQNFESSGPDQFLVRARGGVGINAPPFNNQVELAITADSDGSDFANLFLRQRSNEAGILISVGGSTSTASNSAGFFLDHFNSTGGQARRFELRGNGETVIRSNLNNADSGVFMPAGASAWNSGSDRRLKTAIVAINPREVLDRLLGMSISEWSYIAQGEGIRHLGPMAQDFAATFNLGENDTSISSIDADGVALAAIQGLNGKLESENASLRAQLDMLAREVAALRRIVDQLPSAGER